MSGETANLVLKFRQGDQGRVRVRQASRISLDNRTGLTMTDPTSGFQEVFSLRSLEILAIQSAPGASRMSAAR